MKKWVSCTQHGVHEGTTFKVNKDISDIAQEMGYSPVYIFRYDWENEPQEVLEARIDGITAGLSSGDIFLHLFPTRQGYRFESTLISRLQSRGVTVVIAIIDSQKLHYPEGNAGPDFIVKEHLLFEMANYLIVHSHAMADKLRTYDITTPMLIRGPFEFLMEENEVKLSSTLKRAVTFVGNFVKSPFLLNWELDIPISAFGFLPEHTLEGRPYILSPNVDFMGAKDYLQRMPRDCFGIFWDEGGNHQNYSRYTSPHKVALYLSLGLPVIVWEKSGIAPFVKENNLGLLISSLEDVETQLNALSDEELLALKNHVNNFSYFMRDAIFTKRVLRELEMGLSHDFWPTTI